jgi:ketosteroid isomerase-like protein
MTDRGGEATIGMYFDFVDAEDWTGLRQLWRPDGRLYAVGTFPRHGRDEVMNYYHDLFREWSHHHDQPVRLIGGDDVYAVEVRFYGTTFGGDEVEFDAVDVFELVEGSISRLSSWYDLVALRARLASGPRRRMSS